MMPLQSEIKTRSPQREALAKAIELRDAAAAEAETYVRARERAAADRFSKRRAQSKQQSRRSLTHGGQRAQP
jgi:hypothetical protein